MVEKKYKYLSVVYLEREAQKLRNQDKSIVYIFGYQRKRLTRVQRMYKNKLCYYYERVLDYLRLPTPMTETEIQEYIKKYFKKEMFEVNYYKFDISAHKEKYWNF